MKDMIQYLERIVEPTLKDFESNPTSVRHAFLACVVTFHAIDYLAYPRKSRTIRQKFQRESQDFLLIDRVAHAFKHVAAGTPEGSISLKSNEVISRPPAFFGTAVFGLSRLGDSTGGVTLGKDRNVDLLNTVKRAVAFLREQT